MTVTGGFATMDAGELLVEGGKVSAFVFVSLLVFRGLVFFCNFLAGRYDARQERLEKREVRVDHALSARLQHLETAERRNQQRISVLERAVRLLTTELARIDPANPKLSQVAAMLDTAFEVDPQTPDDMIDKLGNIK